MRSALGRFAALMIAVVGVLAGILSVVFRGPGERQAVWTSAGVAVLVQLAAFALGRMVAGPAGVGVGAGGNLMARMGIGALFRFMTLVVYALLVATVLHLPAVAALISMATFFFLSTLIEPLLIRS